MNEMCMAIEKRVDGMYAFDAEMRTHSRLGADMAEVVTKCGRGPYVVWSNSYRADDVIRVYPYEGDSPDET